MRKIICCIVTLLLIGMLVACSKQNVEETNCSPSEIAEAVIGSQSELPKLYPLTLEDKDFEVYLSNYYRMGSEQLEDGVIYYADGVEASEIAVLLLNEESDMETVKDQLLTYLTKRASDFEGYAPQQAALAENGIVIANGNYVALLICEDTGLAQQAFLDCFAGSSKAEHADIEEPANPITPEKISEMLSETEKPASPTSTDVDTGEDTEVQTTEPSAPTAEVSSWPVVAEGIYSAESVLSAWRTGDTSALTDMNRRIFEAAKNVIAEEINDHMSDYEKELAIHDWMTGWSSFDMNVFSHAPDARAEADNRNPYGFLINRSAMCHGYSSTFQLFMDMLNIECITVFGTPSSSGVEHSWNMVRLDGEWYCVDTAWDDPIGGTPEHTYFNVTSEGLRAGGIHRWDDSTVPEATATEYAYGRH